MRRQGPRARVPRGGGDMRRRCAPSGELVLSAREAGSDESLPHPTTLSLPPPSLPTAAAPAPLLPVSSTDPKAEIVAAVDPITLGPDRIEARRIYPVLR